MTTLLLNVGDNVWLFYEGYYYRGRITQTKPGEVTVYLTSWNDEVTIEPNQVIEVLWD